jgi:hypothetical protein
MDQGSRFKVFGQPVTIGWRRRLTFGRREAAAALQSRYTDRRSEVLKSSRRRNYSPTVGV